MHPGIHFCERLKLNSILAAQSSSFRAIEGGPNISLLHITPFQTLFPKNVSITPLFPPKKTCNPLTIEVSTKEIGNIRQRIYAGRSVRKKREKSVVDNAAAKSGRRHWIKGVLFAKLGEANLIG